MNKMIWAVCAALGLSACGEQTVDLAQLAQSRWQLAQPELNSPRGPLWFEVDADKRLIYGFSGCNRFTGSLGQDAEPRIGLLAQTRMACTEGMDVEPQLIALLEGVGQWTLQNDQLQLVNGQGVASVWQAVAKESNKP